MIEALTKTESARGLQTTTYRERVVDGAKRAAILLGAYFVLTVLVMDIIFDATQVIVMGPRDRVVHTAGVYSVEPSRIVAFCVNGQCVASCDEGGESGLTILPLQTEPPAFLLLAVQAGERPLFRCAPKQSDRNPV